jgi:CheY-like chemotaxis protein
MARRPRILLVEPDETLARVLTVLLEYLGYQVEPASDEIEALRAVYHELPAAIVADAGPPARMGVNLARVLKADPATREVSVIGIEAEGEAAEGAALDAGCVACLRAPLDSQRLLSLLRAAIQE